MEYAMLMTASSSALLMLDELEGSQNCVDAQCNRNDVQLSVSQCCCPQPAVVARGMKACDHWSQ